MRWEGKALEIAGHAFDVDFGFLEVEQQAKVEVGCFEVVEALSQMFVRKGVYESVGGFERFFHLRAPRVAGSASATSRLFEYG